MAAVPNPKQTKVVKIGIENKKTTTIKVVCDHVVVLRKFLTDISPIEPVNAMNKLITIRKNISELIRSL